MEVLNSYFDDYTNSIDTLCNKAYLTKYFKKVIVPLTKRVNEKLSNNTYTESDIRLAFNTARDVVKTILTYGNIVCPVNENKFKAAWSVINNLYGKDDYEYIEFLRFLDAIRCTEEIEIDMK